MECDANLDFWNRDEGISINALAWSATELPAIEDLASKFQSTHSHGVRLQHVLTNLIKIYISINALAWSATNITPQMRENIKISINALAWSATIKRIRKH